MKTITSLSVRFRKGDFRQAFSTNRLKQIMSQSTHYLHNEKALCSHAKAHSDTSDSIVDVTCKHCWSRYDEMDYRKPNVPEMRAYASGLERCLKLSAKMYLSEDKFHFLTEFAFCFFEGPDSVPEDIYQYESGPGEEEKWKYLIAKTRSKHMPKHGRRSNVDPGGVWAEKYQENVDRVIRAVQPALTEKDKAEAARLTSELRETVMKREKKECDICGVDLSGHDSETDVTVTVDHIFPRMLGGPTEEWNLRLLCQSCNTFKHVLLDPSGVEKAADRLEERMAE